MKLIRRIALIFVLVTIAIFSLLSFIPDGKSDVLEKLKAAGIYPKSILIEYNDSLQVHLMEVGDSTKQPLLLIHGSPGEWSAWENIILNDSIRQFYHILSFDRAGYGKTTVPSQDNLVMQADVIWRGMESLGITKDILIVGHSYGGAVVEQLLIDRPKAFVKAVLVAPTLSPDLMAPQWYNKVAGWKLINKIISDDLRASNHEMMGLPSSLLENQSKLSLIRTPIIYIQGLEDVLVPFETMEYFKEYKPLGVKYVIIEDMNHFVPWSDPNLIAEAILTSSGNN